MNPFFTGLFAAALSAIAVTAHGAGGSFELNQACVDVGCFPGDPPGFPVRIEQPGSYVLTSNIVVSELGKVAIRLVSDGIDLDLGGFQVSGPSDCAGNPVTCSAGDFGVGIDGNGITRGTSIRNGKISSFERGIWADATWRISNVTVSHNSLIGIAMRNGVHASNITAYRNKGAGLAGRNGIVSNSVVTENGGVGIGVGDSVVFDNSVFGNLGGGIADWGRSRISRNTIQGNTGFGIQVQNGGALLLGNRISDNSGLGVELLVGGQLGSPEVPTSMKANMLSHNNETISGHQIGGAGTFVETGSNVCGTDLSCP